jgi:flavin reductase (DIM6/NTAB) family NADH-FMN oxidoreductase RutF
VNEPARPLSPELSPAALRRAFGCFPTGVTAVCALVSGGPVGMAASSFAAVSLQPPMVLFCAARSSRTWPRLRTAARLGLSVLSGSQGELGRQLAGPERHRFKGTPWTATKDGAVLLDGAVAWLDCRGTQEVEAGDHWVVLLEVMAVMCVPEAQPLIFHQSRFTGLGG